MLSRAPAVVRCLKYPTAGLGLRGKGIWVGQEHVKAPVEVTGQVQDSHGSGYRVKRIQNPTLYWPVLDSMKPRDYPCPAGGLTARDRHSIADHQSGARMALL